MKSGDNFQFLQNKKELYFDFIKEQDFFIATKEKAFLDAVYLYSFGKYAFDLDSIDISKLETKRLKKLLQVYPRRTQLMVKKLCKL